jgi:hypothetical protein
MSYVMMGYWRIVARCGRRRGLAGGGVRVRYSLFGDGFCGEATYAEDGSRTHTSTR